MILILVYFTGGTEKVYANLLYLPIALVALTNGKQQGVILAFINALLIGPLMPLNVDLSISQHPINWLIRLIIYVMIAFIIGFFADHYKHELEKNKNKDKEICNAQMATIFSLARLSESRDNYTGKHIERVALICKLLAQKLRNISKYENYINDDYIDNIYKASTLHDIGKVGIPDNILLKPGKLTKEEFGIMKKHPTIGANTLLEVQKKYPESKFLELGITITRLHHEKWDGTGYPDGLHGEKIPLSARIMALADAYDALRSKRVYKEAFSHEKSLEILKQSAGSHFDPLIINIFIKTEAEFQKIFDENNEPF